MGLFVNTNIASMTAQRHLRANTSRLNRTFQRLSSGLRINTAADDAAGMAISERLTSQVRGLTQATRNANDGISLVQTAEAALLETTNNLQRIRELAVQAASDVNTDSDRAALHDEVMQLQEELERIGASTTFNQQNILDGSFLNKYLHVGMNFRERLGVRINDARSTALGRWAVQTGTAVTTNALVAGDLTINGITVRATRPTDDQLSTSFASGSAIAKASAINDSTDFTTVTAYTNATDRTGQADIGGGTLDDANNVVINGQIITGIRVVAGDPDDGLIRAINAVSSDTGVRAYRGVDGRIALTAEDGRNIEVVSNGNGGIITGLGASGVTLGTVTLHSENQYTLGGNNESYLGFVDGTSVGVTSVQAVSTLDVRTRNGSNLALLVVDRALDQIARDRATLGAVQNRLDAMIRNLGVVTEQASAARSRIQDADFAAETAALSREQILQQAATTVLAQANTAPQQALALLQ